MGYKTIIVKNVKVHSESNLNIALPRDDNFVISEDLEKLYFNNLPEETQKCLKELKNLNKILYQRLLQETYFENLISKNNNEVDFQILNEKIKLSLQIEMLKKAKEKDKTKIQKLLEDKINNLKKQKRNIELNNLQKRIEELRSENKKKN